MNPITNNLPLLWLWTRAVTLLFLIGLLIFLILLVFLVLLFILLLILLLLNRSLEIKPENVCAYNPLQKYPRYPTHQTHLCRRHQKR